MKGEKGFSLLEIIMAVALTGVIALGGSELLRIMGKSKERAEENQSILGLHGAMRKLSVRTTSAINSRMFKRSNTYHIIPDTAHDVNDPNNQRRNSSIARVGRWIYTGGPADGGAGVHDNFYWEEEGISYNLNGNTFPIDSHTLQVYSIATEESASEAGEQEVEGLLVARCISKSDVGRDWDVGSIAGLNLRPYTISASAHNENQKGLKVFCCPTDIDQPTAGNCNVGVGESDSDYRTRLFHIVFGTAADGSRDPSNVSVMTYPKQGEIRYITSAGMMLNFNRGTKPTAFTANFFTISNDCQSDEDRSIERECRGRKKVQSWTRKSEVTSINSGTINMGR